MSSLHLFSFFLFITVVLVPEPGETVLKSWLELMTKCPGTCYFYPNPLAGGGGTGQKIHECSNFLHGPTGREDSSGSWKAASRLPCRYVVSIQPHHPTCDTFDRQPFNDRLCAYFKSHKNPHLYLITVAQKFPIDGCNMRQSRNPPFTLEDYMAEVDKDFSREGTCNVWDENVAFALSPSRVTNISMDGMELDKIYYVCTNEGITAYPYNTGYETRDVGSLRPIPPKSQRISLAAPYSDSPPGILWSQVTKPPGERTIICSFILATDKFEYRTSTWKVGLVGGKEIAKHDILPGTLRPQYIHYEGHANLWLKVGTARIKRYYYPEGMEVFATLPDADQEIWQDHWIFTKWITWIQIQGVEHSADPVDLRKLVPAPTFKKEGPIDPVVNAAVLKKIDSIYASCRDKRALCYNFPWEEGCQSREKCHMLVVIEEYFDFERIHVDMLTHPSIPHPVVHPYSYGWMGFAFSKDSRMGGEAVFTCSYKGRAGNCADEVRAGGSGPAKKSCSKVYITLNLEHPNQKGVEKNNYYSENNQNNEFGDYQKLLESKKVEFAQVASESQPRVLCSFDFRTVDYANFSAYPKRPSEILRYDLLNKEYYVLMATGRSVVGDWDISYHGKGNRASGSGMKFSREIYENLVTKVGVGHHDH